MKKVEIHVTRDDINNGCKYCARACPVYLALRRKLPTVVAVYDVVEFLDFITLKDSYVKTPVKVLNWIRKYDNDNAMKPFKFTIEVSDACPTI